MVFTSHFWPRWGSVAIGEAIALPPPLARAWFNRPNYGSLNFNARAVFQRHLGLFEPPKPGSPLFAP